MSECRIYIFRHGITDWNKQTKFQGHSDIPLNNEGKEQAEELCAHLESFEPDIILCSDLLRARETALIASKNLQIQHLHDKRLREFNLGVAEGLQRTQVQELVGDLGWQKWLSIDPVHHDFGFPQGETKRQLMTRVVSFVEEYIDKNAPQKIAISTHGGVIKTLCHSIAPQLPTEAVPISNCCLYELSFNIANREWKFQRMVSRGASTGPLK